jgi:SulP family sulfate permease
MDRGLDAYGILATNRHFLISSCYTHRWFGAVDSHRLFEETGAKFLAAASLMAVMVGVAQVLLGVSRLGLLVNFVSDSVIIGYTAGAGILIAANQLRHLLRLDVSSSSRLLTTLNDVLFHLPVTHWPSLLIGLGTIVFLLLQKRFLPKWPGPLLVMIVSAALVGVMGLDTQGVEIIGEIPTSLPPLTDFSLWNFDLIYDLSSGALAISAIGLVQAIAIARSIAGQSRQRLDSNQEFIGQGFANLLSGLFSGYSVSGSISRSAMNYELRARSTIRIGVPKNGCASRMRFSR